MNSWIKSSKWLFQKVLEEITSLNPEWYKNGKDLLSEMEFLNPKSIGCLLFENSFSKRWKKGKISAKWISLWFEIW